MSELKIAAVPLESVAGDKISNLSRIERSVTQAVTFGAHLVCFPAMAVTGYWERSEAALQAEIMRVDNSNPALVHPKGASVLQLEALARRIGCWLAAGIIEDADYYHLRNSIGVFGREGLAGIAAEIHTPVARHPTFVSGRECGVVDLGGIRLGVMVGSDVLYPEVARMLVLQGAQLLLAALATPLDSTNKPPGAWSECLRSVLSVRALENGVPIVGVEAAGTVINAVEKTSHRFCGEAMAFGPDGQVLEHQWRDDHGVKVLLVDVHIPEMASSLIAQRRPAFYASLTSEPEPQDTPGTRQSDWDAQGELIWSRLRDAGFFEADLYSQSDPAWTRRRRSLVVTTPALPPLDGYRAIVLTRPCLARLAEEQASEISQWVEAGGVLVLDGYDGRNTGLRSVSGLRGPLSRELFLPSYSDASRRTARVSFHEGTHLARGLDCQHRPKVWGQVWLDRSGTPTTAEPLATLCASSGEAIGPVVYRHAFGKGTVYAFTYSLGYSQLLLMEGRGSLRDLGSFPPRVAENVTFDGDVNTWGEQVVTDADDQFFPSADYHLIPLLNILLDATACEWLVSPVPAGAEFGVIFTGDSDRADADLINRYTSMLAAHGIQPTQFILRARYRARELDPGCEYGIHPLFHETERSCFDEIVSYGFAPDQLVSGRRHCLIQYGLTETLERMAACGIRYTSNNWDFPYPETNSTAFLFGTALPHHVYDWTGRRIGIVDIPQVFMDYPPFVTCTQAAYHDVRRSHGVGAWNYHPQNLVMPEVVQSIEWLAGHIRSDGPWCGTMREYGDWYLVRDRIVLDFDTDGGMSVVSAGLSDLTLLCSKREMRINGVPSRAERKSTWYGRDYWIHLVRDRVPSEAAHNSPTA